MQTLKFTVIDPCIKYLQPNIGYDFFGKKIKVCSYSVADTTMYCNNVTKCLISMGLF